jgi:hypothetical protein
MGKGEEPTRLEASQDGVALRPAPVQVHGDVRGVAGPGQRRQSVGGHHVVDEAQRLQPGSERCGRGEDQLGAGIGATQAT